MLEGQKRWIGDTSFREAYSSYARDHDGSKYPLDPGIYRELKDEHTNP